MYRMFTSCTVYCRECLRHTVSWHFELSICIECLQVVLVIAGNVYVIQRDGILNLTYIFKYTRMIYKYRMFTSCIAYCWECIYKNDIQISNIYDLPRVLQGMPTSYSDMVF